MSSSPRPSSSSDDSGRSSPLQGFDSSAALILVPDTDDPAASTPFGISSDDEYDSDEDSDGVDRLQASAFPPLSSISVFLYLFSPFLKLGALFLPNAGLPLKVAIPTLLFFSALAIFTRQIWYMLARYVRRADLEEIVLETFARDRRKEGRRWALRKIIRLASGAFRVLLAAIYVRAAVDVLLPLLPERLFLPSNVTVTLVVALIVAPLYFAQSLGIARVIYATWVSLAAYAAWFICTAFSHSRGFFVKGDVPLSIGALWQGVSIVAFTFTTSSTTALYTSLRGTTQPLSPRPRRSQSFKLLSALSVGIAVLCVLPLVFFQPANSPASQERPLPSPNQMDSSSPLDTTPENVLAARALFETAALALSVPSVLIPTPALPIPSRIRRVTRFPFTRVLVYIAAIMLSLVSPSFARALSDAVWLLAFFSTYMLPALLHIIIHNFRSPLSIIIPPSTPATAFSSPGLPSAQSDASDSRNDELLQRKERTLQRRRLGRRLVWDFGVWMLLVPVGGGGMAWAAGRLAGKW
ncbi:hypothetical protein DAEQUDRAFT_812944 [Daedalea quercina L-15889]|uniref:Amino acid transporter transmembrane domain-containing protein n=1 Tax=Daedalea quercina L-15889 TaxID=1314783 RepID=A0A165NQ11_9APHY|nr:hypothetical protein DAEQUDRAFT_812944 [Daedalea quercina L-15889]